MARTPLTPTKITVAGAAPVGVAAVADGHSVKNTGREFVLVDNASGSTVTVTVVTPITVGGRAVADDAVSIPAGQSRYIGPWPIDVYNQKPGVSGSDVHLNLSATASVTIGAYQLPTAS